MLDIGWAEMLVVAVLVIIVVGPKDLPRLLRTTGRWVGKAREMARDFQNSLDEITRESDLDEIKRGIEAATHVDFKKELETSIDPSGTMAGAFDHDPRDAAALSASEAPGSGEAADIPSGATPDEDHAAEAPEPTRRTGS